MAKLQLDVESNALKVFNDAAQGMNGLREGVNSFEKESKNSFDKSAKETVEYTAKIQQNAAATVDASNKIVTARKKEAQEILLLKKQIAEVVEYEKKLAETRAKTAPGEQQQKLNKKLAETRFELKELQKELAKTEEAEKSLVQPVQTLKAQLRELKEQLGNATDPEEFNRLSIAAGEVQDKISDASASIKAFAADSKASTAKTLFTQIVSDIGNLDFKAAADKAKLFSLTIKSITFKDTIDGIKSFGSAMLSVGNAIITSPFFLIIGALVAIGIAIKGVFDSIDAGKQALEDNAKALKEVTDATDDLARANRDLALDNKIMNESISKNDGERLKNQNRLKDEYLKLLQEQREKTAEFNEAIQKEREEDGFKATKKLYEFFGGETELTARHKIGLKNIEESFGKQLEEIKEKFRLEDQKNRIEDNLEKAKKAKEYADKLKQYEKDLQAALLDLRRRAEQEELKGLFGEAKINRQRELNLRDLQLLRETIQKKGELVNKNFKFTEEQEKQFAAIGLEINREYFEELIKLRTDQIVKSEQAEKQAIDNELSNLELRNKIAVDTINAARARDGANAAEKAAFEKAKQKQLLFQQLKYEQEKLKITIDGIEQEKRVKRAVLEAEFKVIQDRTDEVSVARKKVIADELKAISDNSELQKQAASAATKNVIKGIEDEIAKLGPHKINIAKLLQLDNTEIAAVINLKFNASVSAEDIANAKDATKQLVQSLKEIINYYFEQEQERLNKELEANQKRIDARTENINSLKSDLKKEEELKNQGLANDVDRIKAKIKEEEAARLRDLEHEKEIKKEKARLAKQQLVIDTVTQASQLVLAIAQLYGSLSSFTIGPVPVGVIIATATAAAMTGAFIAGKKKAFDAVNQGNNFAKGVIDLQGPGTETSDSIPSNLSKGESVMTAEETRNNKNLLKGIRLKNNKLIEIGVRDLLKNTGVTLSDDLPAKLSNTKFEAQKAEYNATVVTDNSGIENRLDRHEQLFKTISSNIQDKEFVDANGNTIIKKGSITKIIRKK